MPASTPPESFAFRVGRLLTQDGVAGCRCKASPPKKHGPYYQISFTRKGRSGSRFVRREDLATVKRQLKNYARLRKLVDEWIDRGTELATLRVQAERESAGK